MTSAVNGAKIYPTPPRRSKERAQRHAGKRIPAPKAPSAGSDASLAKRSVQPEAPKKATPIIPPQPLVPEAATTAIQITPSPESLASIATLKPKENEYVYTYKNAEVSWKGKRYRLTLEVPLEKKISEYKDINELHLAAKKFADIFLQDLIQQLDSKGEKCPITPGENFSVLFNEEQGYLAFTPPENFDYYSATTQTITEKYRHVLADSEASLQLSKLISSAKPETFPTELSKPEFKSLREAVNKQANATQGPFRPIGLRNFGGNNCFLNTAFQQWITNPILREELLSHSTSYFVNGENNSLYKAMEGYVQHQKSGKKTPYSLDTLATELGIDPTAQNEQEEVQRFFEQQLDFKNIPLDSPLYSLTKRSRLSSGETEWREIRQDAPSLANRLITPKEGATIAELLEEESVDEAGNKHREQFAQPPGTLTIATKRTKLDNEPAKLQFIDALKAKKADELFSNNDKAIFQKETLSNAEKVQLADTLRKDSANWALAAKNYVEETTRFTANLQTKDEAALDISSLEMTLPKEVCGEKTDYQLISYTSHLGTALNGHWETYYRDGKTFWKISDNSVTSLTEEDFLKGAKTASSYTFVRNDLSPSIASTESTTKKEETNKKIGEETVGLSQIKLIEERGSLAKAGNFAIVNPTDGTLNRVHSQIAETEKGIHDQIDQVRRAKANSKWFKKEIVEYKINDVEETNGSSKKVLHVVMPEPLNPQYTKEEIEKAVTAVLTKAAKAKMYNVAFPVLLAKDKSAQDIEYAKACMQLAIEKFSAEQSNRVDRIKEVKIVLTEEQQKLLKEANKGEETPSPIPPKAPAAPTPLSKPEPAKPVELPTTISVTDKLTLLVKRKKTVLNGNSSIDIQEATFKNAVKEKLGNPTSETTVSFDFTNTSEIRNRYGYLPSQEDYRKLLKGFKEVVEEFMTTHKDHPKITLEVTLPEGVEAPQITAPKSSSMLNTLWAAGQKIFSYLPLG